MAMFDRMRERLRGRQPVGAAEDMLQPGAAMTTMDMNRMRRNRTPEQEPDLEQLTRARTPEEDAAYRLGEQMGAEGLMQLAGVTPIRQQQIEMENRLMNRERLNKATNTLLAYRSGKTSVNRRVIKAQEWWKLNNWKEIREEGIHGVQDNDDGTAWLWNSIVGKHADAMDSFPEPIILPRMQDDKEEANRLSKIVPMVLQINEFEQVYSDVMWQKLQEGTGVYGVFWDSSKLNGLGDVSIKKVNILNLYWKPGVDDIEDSKNVFYVSFEDKEDMIEQYPELDGQLNTSKVFIEKYKYDDSIDWSNKVAVIDWYYKKNVNGRNVLHYCKYVNETCLYSSEEQGLTEGFYEDGEYPFVLDPLFPVAGSPAGYGYIDIAHGAQKKVDELSQAMVLNAIARSTPRYINRGDSGINEKEFLSWWKPVIHASGNVGEDALRPVEVQPMGADAFNMLQHLVDEIKFVTGNTDVNNGGVPAGVTAAAAIAALKEDSGRSSKDSNKSSYRFFVKLTKKTMSRMRQNYEIPRYFRILGQDGQEEFELFSNAGMKVQQMPNLMGQDPVYRLPIFDIDVRAQRENAYTRLSQNELALQFWSIGVLNPQMTDQALILLDMMDFRGKEELRKKIQQQGTMMDMLIKVTQIVNQMAMNPDPAMISQLSMMLQGMAMDTGMAAPAAGEAPKIGTAPDDASAAPHDPNENAIVRRASERAANASRPN